MPPAVKITFTSLNAAPLAVAFNTMSLFESVDTIRPCARAPNSESSRVVFTTIGFNELPTSVVPGVVPGGKEVSGGQSGSEGGRAGQQQESGAGDGPPSQTAEQKEQARHRRERGECEANPPEELGYYEGSRIPKESPPSTRERGAEEQANGQ